MKELLVSYGTIELTELARRRAVIFPDTQIHTRVTQTQQDHLRSDSSFFGGRSLHRYIFEHVRTHT